MVTSRPPVASQLPGWTSSRPASSCCWGLPTARMQIWVPRPRAPLASVSRHLAAAAKDPAAMAFIVRQTLDPEAKELGRSKETLQKIRHLMVWRSVRPCGWASARLILHAVQSVSFGVTRMCVCFQSVWPAIAESGSSARAGMITIPC